MANPLLLRTLRRFSLRSSNFRQLLVRNTEPSFTPLQSISSGLNNSWLSQWRRSFSYGTVNLVISPQGKPKFEITEIDPPKKHKWMKKKQFKARRMREKKKRKAANKRDPRRLTIKGNRKKQRFATAAERIEHKIENAKVKEGLLIERLKKYEVPKAQGPVVEPHPLTGEERFYMKKMAQKRSNYVPIGVRGVFGGVILNMHLHWKKHETVKVICKPCKPGQVHEYADEIARLSGGIPIQIIGDDTVVFYRGKNYVQPKVMSPVDTLTKKKALEKAKYEQSLESVRRFIAISEKELELYYRHVALYGDPNVRDPKSILNDSSYNVERASQANQISTDRSSDISSDEEVVCSDEGMSEIEENYDSESELDSEEGILGDNMVLTDQSIENCSWNVEEGSLSSGAESLDGIYTVDQCKPNPSKKYLCKNMNSRT